MAKKRVRKPQNEEGKTRLQLRFDDEVYLAVQKFAAEAGVSVNEFMQSIARWAVEHGRLGEPVVYEEAELFQPRARPGCIWFDSDDRDDPEEMAQNINNVFDIGRLVFWLDLTGRSAVKRNTEVMR